MTHTSVGSSRETYQGTLNPSSSLVTLTCTTVRSMTKKTLIISEQRLGFDSIKDDRKYFDRAIEKSNVLPILESECVKNCS